jgi:NADH-quinone oxidoreductase subunit G
MPTLTIDGIEVTVEPGSTVLQACEAAGAEIPRFCYHERLSIAGNCRMCLVEMEKAPKPIASCAMPAADGMTVHTKTESVKAAREGVMEFLLINHPLDCPICDQGGECDLQDQAMGYGRGESRYDEIKRAVSDKNMGPLISTTMTRCIHCMRCVRFATEIAGADELGSLGRGEHTEVTTFLEQSLNSELSGNVIDLCPVGALTSKPYAFTARSWELTKTESIDVMDAVGSNIRIDSRSNQVMRILPRLHEDINEEWISDKTRFNYDGLRYNRLDQPYARAKKGAELKATTWKNAFSAAKKALKGLKKDNIGAIIGDLADMESILALRDLLSGLGSSNIECRQDGSAVGASNRGDYLFNTSIAGIEQADACLLVGCNPRNEATLINTRLRKSQRAGVLGIANIGPETDLTYPVSELGNDLNILTQVLEGTNEYSNMLEAAAHPMLIVGRAAQEASNGAEILATCQAIAHKYGLISDDWNGFNVLHSAASRVGALDLGLTVKGGVDAVAKAKVVFLLGADEIDMANLGSAFVIYIGSHGDAGAAVADVILPAAAYSEKSGTYINTEGRVQRGGQATFAPGEAREDWSILRALSDVLGKPLPYDNLTELRRALAAACPHVADRDLVNPGKVSPGQVSALSGSFAPGGGNYYLSNPIARSSRILAEVIASQSEEGATGTDG